MSRADQGPLGEEALAAWTLRLFPFAANTYQVPSESWTIEGSGKSILINGLIAVARSMESRDWRADYKTFEQRCCFDERGYHAGNIVS